MNEEIRKTAEELIRNRNLSGEGYASLIRSFREPGLAEMLSAEAVRIRKAHYGNAVYVRGLLEISNYCKNDCRYCGIRRSNRAARRYRLYPQTILECVRAGYAMGFRTFVLQGGEDAYFTDEVLEGLIAEIKAAAPGCAVTLSLGERSTESYRRLFRAGADRYLLRHETADREHYALLHPAEMSFDNRMRCLEDLREIGFQTGCGIMVGSPGQTAEHLAKDLEFIRIFQPEMCGVGPFIPHRDTPFRDEPAGSPELTCFLLSVIRILCPEVLLPATTALGTIREGGREKGIESGANVVMPNLSPPEVRGQYELYNNKLSTGAESAEARDELAGRMRAIGYELEWGRGDAYARVHGR